MAIIQDVARPGNQNGRVGDSIKDGQATRYIELINDVIVVTASDLDDRGRPVELHRNHDLVGRNIFVRTIECERSGFDGKLIVSCFGFTPNTDDSRKVVIKTDLVIAREA